MFKNIQCQISTARDWYYTFNKKIHLLTNIEIKNKQLAKELELACVKHQGILTYAEYLTIEQFGKYGYYATHITHGQTDVDTRWGAAIARYCIENNFRTIIEFGCGTGELGAAIIKEYKKLSTSQLKWIGIEIDKNIHKKIFEIFRINKVQAAIEKIVTSYDEISVTKDTLILFPYSLDNIPPQEFINTHPSLSYPDALLGVTISNNVLSEVIIPQKILQKKGIKFEKGLFMQNNTKFDLKTWKIRKGQRAFIPIDSYAALYQLAKKSADTTMIIIDEFSKEPWSYNYGNIGTPKSLYEKNLLCTDRKRYFQESGKYNLYYPMYKDSFAKFLSGIGFQSITYDVEHKMAAKLQNKPWFSLNKNHSTLSFFAKQFIDRNFSVLPIPFPIRNIV